MLYRGNNGSLPAFVYANRTGTDCETFSDDDFNTFIAALRAQCKTSFGYSKALLAQALTCTPKTKLDRAYSAAFRESLKDLRAEECSVLLSDAGKAAKPDSIIFDTCVTEAAALSADPSPQDPCSFLSSLLYQARGTYLNKAQPKTWEKELFKVYIARLDACSLENQVAILSTAEKQLRKPPHGGYIHRFVTEKLRDVKAAAARSEKPSRPQDPMQGQDSSNKVTKHL